MAQRYTRHPLAHVAAGEEAAQLLEDGRALTHGSQQLLQQLAAGQPSSFALASGMLPGVNALVSYLAPTPRRQGATSCTAPRWMRAVRAVYAHLQRVLADQAVAKTTARIQHGL